MKVFLLLSFIFSSALFAETTPTIRLNQSISFADDMDFKNLDIVIDRQLKSFAVVGLKGTIKLGTTVFPKTVLKKSLELLRTLSNEAQTCMSTGTKAACMAEFNRKMNAQFAIFAPMAKNGRRVKRIQTQFTSYYSPDLHGSRVKTEKFKTPIYRKPNAPHDNYTRVDIDFNGALAGKGYEVFWVQESFYDLYLLHVQGGGRIHVTNPDGSVETKYLSYDGKNTRSFQMIYKYMIQKGYLKSDNAGIPAQRKFMEENPDKQEEIFGSCPSYVYFRESDQEPVGLNMIPLTEGRSLAIDNTIYPTMGLINFVETVKASHVDENGRIVKVPFSRFFVSQDTGGAIRGPARCDLYFGYGELAELTAYNMNEQGNQYFLIAK